MALAFESVRVPIPQTTGAFSTNENRSFEKDVRVAEVAIKSFKLDYVGGARTSDVVQVTASVDSIGDDTVDFTVKTNYSGGTYSGEISVLIIADLEDRRAPIS
jgi:acyl-CoA thioesterase FadM